MIDYSNPEFCATGELDLGGRAHEQASLAEVLTVGFRVARTEFAYAYVIQREKQPHTLVLQNRVEVEPLSGSQSLPGPTDAETCAALAQSWLRRLTCDEKLPYPNNDGSINSGWRAFIGAHWGFHGFIAVEPYWVIYGK